MSAHRTARQSDRTTARQEALLRRFGDYLQSRGFSVTAPRRAVLAEIARMGGHFDVEELATRLRRRTPPVSRATAYRTVNLLERSGMLRRLDFDQPNAHYECTATGANHEHLVCSRCGAITEVTDRQLERRIAAVAREHGFTLTGHAVHLVGLCRACRSAVSAAGPQGGVRGA